MLHCISYSYLMSEKSIDQNIFPEVLGTARCVLLPEFTEWRSCVTSSCRQHGSCGAPTMLYILSDPWFIFRNEWIYILCKLKESDWSKWNAYLKYLGLQFRTLILCWGYIVIVAIVAIVNTYSQQDIVTISLCVSFVFCVYTVYITSWK